MLKLLIIEDDVIDQLALTRLVKKNNLACEITISVKIEDAKYLLETKAFDLVICDLNLPDGKAFDLGDLIRNQAFVLLSGHLEEEIIQLANEHGAIQVLQKSSELTQLTSVRQLIINLLNEKVDSTPLSSLNTKISNTFNLQKLLTTFDHKPEPVIEIIEAILEHTPKMLDNMQTEVSNSNRNSIRLLAHRLKSNYIMIGLKEQHKMAENIELHSSQDELPTIQRKILALKKSLKPIYPELMLALKNLKSN